MTTMPASGDTRAAVVLDALERYRGTASPHYDEVLDEVTAMAARDGSLGKTGIGALVAWKRLNASTKWMSRFMSTPDAQVRQATIKARHMALSVAPGRDLEEAAALARSSLSHLPGFRTGDAVASAVLVALAPDVMAVYDRRAHAGLTRIGLKLDDRSGRYSRYMALIEHLRHEAMADRGRPIRAREIDLALYTLGGPTSQR